MVILAAPPHFRHRHFEAAVKAGKHVFMEKPVAVDPAGIRQVIEAGKLASIGELAAGIAHEINNPVAIMIEEAGWIQDLLEEEVLTDASIAVFDALRDESVSDEVLLKYIHHPEFAYRSAAMAKVVAYNRDHLIVPLLKSNDPRLRES